MLFCDFMLLSYVTLGDLKGAIKQIKCIMIIIIIIVNCPGAKNSVEQSCFSFQFHLWCRQKILVG